MNGSIALIKKTPGSPFHLWLSELGKVTVKSLQTHYSKDPRFCDTDKQKRQNSRRRDLNPRRACSEMCKTHPQHAVCPRPDNS
jgi:hypothetical protein